MSASAPPSRLWIPLVLLSEVSLASCSLERKIVETPIPDTNLTLVITEDEKQMHRYQVLADGWVLEQGFLGPHDTDSSLQPTVIREESLITFTWHGSLITQFVQFDVATCEMRDSHDSALRKIPECRSHITSDTDPNGGDAKSACERAADNWFKKNYPLPDEQMPVGSGKATYRSHFSSTKSNCFILAVATAHIRKDGATDNVDSAIQRLIDLKTDQQIGQLVIFSNHLGLLWCEVGKAKCRSVEEWNALAGSYMKD